MTSARDQILGGIARGLRREPVSRQEGNAAVEARIEAQSRNTVPERSAVPHPRQVELFLKMAEEMACTTARVGSLAEIPAAVAEYLARHNLPPRVKVGPDPSLDTVPWDLAPLVEVARGRGEDEDLSAVTGAFAGVAETGTIVLASSESTSTRLNFLPDNHIVVLRRSQVVGAYEDAWDRLRAAGAMPRTVNFVTGPSRTGDIEQRIQLGAHGPRRLHLILVDGSDA